MSRMQSWAGVICLFLLILTAAADCRAEEYGPPAAGPGSGDIIGDDDGDGVPNGIDSCPNEWSAGGSDGCPTCAQVLAELGISDLDAYLDEYNFGLVLTCADGRSVYRCGSPDADLLKVLRACRAPGISNVICLSGGLTGGPSRLLDNRCRAMSERACEAEGINFHNECRPPVDGIGDVGDMTTLLEEFYGWTGDTLIHCYHGQDRTGVVSSLILALEGCRGLAEPQRTECIDEIRDRYLLNNDDFGALDVGRYPDLLDYFDQCVDEIVPPLPMPTCSATPAPSSTPLPMPTYSPTPAPSSTPLPMPTTSPTPAPSSTPPPMY